MKCFAWAAVTYSVNRDKNCRPSAVIAPSTLVQSRWPDNSTAGREARANHAVRGSTWTEGLV